MYLPSACLAQCTKTPKIPDKRSPCPPHLLGEPSAEQLMTEPNTKKEHTINMMVIVTGAFHKSLLSLTPLYTPSHNHQPPPPPTTSPTNKNSKRERRGCLSFWLPWSIGQKYKSFVLMQNGLSRQSKFYRRQYTCSLLLHFSV